MIVLCGMGFVFGCCIFLIWNGYFGLFVDLVIGNMVIVKLYLGVILLFVIMVWIVCDVLCEVGFDLNVVMLFVIEFNDGVLV